MIGNLMNPTRTLLTLTLMALGTVSHPAFANRVTLIRTPDGGIQPQAAVDTAGVVHLIYYKGDPSGGDIYYAKWTPAQTEFSKPLKVNNRPDSAIAMGTIRGAQLAIGKNGRVHVAWNGRPPENGSYKEAPMLYARLNDAGTEFEPERNVIRYAGGLDGGGSIAADNSGNVFVMWHAPKPGDTNEEAGRAVFVARSADEGKTFAPEKLATANPTGACGCCGMKAFADSQGNVFALYRGASEMTNRNEILLMSHNHGESFDLIYEHPWRIGSCPMSSAFLSESRAGVLAAAETHERVFFVRVDTLTGKISAPVSPEIKAKHPVVLGNSKGEVLLAWTEGTGWAKGGMLAWQIYGPDGQPIGETGRADGVPTWSLVTAFAQPSGDFTIVY